MKETKQVIVIRRDLKMRRGKEIAQGSHASMAWLTERLAHPESYPPNLFVTWLEEAQKAWLSGTFTKVVCQVPDEETLVTVYQRAREAGVIAHIITDLGYTEFHGEPTNTAVAVGPDWADVIDKITGDLKLY
jgi:PTH2 family peptidyl-tRNA hydrolase